MADMENKSLETEAAEAVEETEVVEAPSVAEEKVPAKKKKDAKTGFFAKIGGFFARVGRRIAKFCRDYNSERKKIVWKPWREVCKSSAVVVVSVLVFSAIILGIDTVFDSLFKWIAGLI